MLHLLLYMSTKFPVAEWVAVLFVRSYVEQLVGGSDPGRSKQFFFFWPAWSSGYRTRPIIPQ